MRAFQKIVLGILLFPHLLPAQWQALPNPNPSEARQIFEFDGQLLVSDNLGLARSADGGIHWQRISSDGRFEQVMPSGSDLYGIRNDPASGQRKLLKTSDTGQHWDTLGSFFIFEVTAMAEANGCIYILTNHSAPLATVEKFDLGTQQLTQLGLFIDNNKRGFDLKVCGDAAFFASDWGLIRYKNCGAVVDTFFPNVRHTLLAVKGDTVFSANDNHDLVYSIDFGDTWQIIPHQGAWAVPLKLLFLNGEPWMIASDYVLSCDAKLWRLDNSLDNGTLMFHLRERCINDIAALDNGNLVVATRQGIMTANWSENAWFVNNTGLGEGQFFIHPQGDLLLQGPIGQWGNIYSPDFGDTWTFPISDNQFDFNLYDLVKLDSFYYASLGYSGLWRSNDLRNWDSIAFGISPLIKVGDYLMSLSTDWHFLRSQDGINWDLTSGYLPGALIRYATDEGYLFIIQSPTGHQTLARSADYGVTWADPGLGIHLGPTEDVLNFSIHGPDIYVVVFDNAQQKQKGFYVSHDYGNQWKFIPAPSEELFLYPFTGNDHLFFATNGHQIWATSNEGELWGTLDLGEIEGQIVNLAIANEQLFVSTTKRPWRRDLSGIDIQQYSGTVFNDLNFNGLRDPLEPGFPNAIIQVSNQNQYVTTDSLGHYTMISELLNDTISVVNPSPYCSVLPPFALIGDGSLTHDFALQFQANVSDVSITAANTQVFRQGFETEVVVSLQNEGAKPEDAVQVILANFDDAVPLQFLEAVPPPNSILGDSLIWDNLSLGLFEGKNLHIRFWTPFDALLGSTVVLPFSVGATGDTNLNNNEFTLTESVVYLFDPNDKQVEPDTLAQASLSATDLKYTIRFQNPGNIQADFVRILDTLPEELELSSLKILGSSHPCSWQILDGRVLQFQFKAIGLPDSLTDEPGSHGFVQFSIRALGDLPFGTKIWNRAAIYFDSNAPVVTDFSLMQVANPFSHTAIVGAEPRLLLRPNPASTSVVLEKGDDAAAWLEVYTSDGRQILARKTTGSHLSLPVHDWPNGPFVIQWRSAGKLWSAILIKK